MCIQNGVIQQFRPAMALDRLDMVRGFESGGFPGLPHQIDEVSFDGRRAPDGVRNATHQKIGNDTGEQRAGAERDQIGVFDGR